MPARRTRQRNTALVRATLPGYATIAPWARVWWLLLETGWAAPQVIAHRTQRMLRSGAFAAPADRDEFRRMFDEKAEAWSESTLRMSAEIGRQWFAFAGAMMQPWWLAPGGAASAARWHSAWCGATRRWMRSAPHIARIGLAPVHRRASANARRLARSSE
ncbi:MAG: hypothetical protein M9885_00555 [Burkholderiaceae bacterium]|nr:hypothetical protein [Burkholderiaceae bacterium]